jgi:WD40 repeat protein/tRNA A-37 threonylcarbamoyl transferase component Bud32
MIGRIISGRYEILEHLGSGGFSETYLAQDRQLPDFPRCVVKKLQLSHRHTEELDAAKRLFETEAKVLYNLSQSCNQVPRLLAHFQEEGANGEPEFFLVQEFVEGRDLSYELLPGKQFSETETIALLKDILTVLNHVHQYGVIHQDIKPRNLLRRAEDNKIVLLDFGAVKQITRQLIYPATPNLGSSTISLGTPAYMSNEQQGGKPRLSSDIYSVGIVCIQALTGLHPGQLHEDFDTGEILWRDHAPPISNRLATILTRMVRSHFRDRYQSAQEVLQDLEPAIAVSSTSFDSDEQSYLQTSTASQPNIFSQANPSQANPSQANPSQPNLFVPPSQLIALNGRLVAEPISTAQTGKPNPTIGKSSSPIPSIIPFPTPNGNRLAHHSVNDLANNPVNDLENDSANAAVNLSDTQAINPSDRTQPIQIPAILEFAPEPPVNSQVNTQANAQANFTLDSETSAIAPQSSRSQPKRSIPTQRKRRPWLWLPLLLGLTGLGYWFWQSRNQPAIAPMVAEQFKLATTLTVHKGPVFAVVISPDGKTFVSASGDRTLRKWSMDTNELLHTFGGSEKGAQKDGHQKDVAIAAISPDGRTLVSGGRDNVVKVWDYQSGRLIHTLVGHTDWIRTVAVSPDNQLIASAGVDHDIRIWDRSSGDLIRTIKGHSSEIEGLVITPDGRTLISGSEDETIKLWNLQSGQLIRTIPGNGEEIEFIDLAPDGKTLVGGGEDRTYIWDITDGDLVRALPEESGIMRTVMVSPDNQTMVGSYQDNTLKLWNFRTGKRLRTLTGHKDWVLYTAISPDGKTIISGSRDKTIKIWQTMP